MPKVDSNTQFNGPYKSLLRPQQESVSHLDLGDQNRPITVIANQAILEGFDDNCLKQAVQARLAPGVTDLVLNPDAHYGYGAPVGCVITSPTHIYPGPVGVDIKCSMSLLQLDIQAAEIQDRRVRRELIKAICQRIPTGPGRSSRSVPKSRQIDQRLGLAAATEGGSKNVLRKLGIPGDWADRCEDWRHLAPDGSIDSLVIRMEKLLRDKLGKFGQLSSQLGSYGGGNHFGECEVVCLSERPELRAIGKGWGLRDGCVAFLSHCGSRGLGHTLATHQFSNLRSRFKKTGLGFPSGDPDLVYAEVGSPQASEYLTDMAIGANFATVNHLLINQLVLEAFQQIFPSARGQLIYFISHNIARQELVDGQLQWVHRKGATRAMPAGHAELERTLFAETGHPILLPGNPRDGSAVLVAKPSARASRYSVNHGAGRSMSRSMAKRSLSQQQVDQDLEQHDILSNCRLYPKDEAPSAYKDFRQVIDSVLSAGLASQVAHLAAKFVIKDSAESDD
jgi:tRNA-splicing ligase RtcB